MTSRRAFLATVQAAASVIALERRAHSATQPPSKLDPLPIGKVKLLPGQFSDRAKLNREYVASLKDDNLLQNFYLEAGLTTSILRRTSASAHERGDDMHWGWESPTCQLRGHFLGHWLSAASYISAIQSDAEISGKLTRVIAELARVQQANGGRWAASIPEKYLDWVAQKRQVWAPHYTVHKTFMGLVDAVKIAGNQQALAIAENFALWFHQWSGRFTREQFNDILDEETGGMLEVWSDLYGITGKGLYRELMDRYYRPRLFDRLLEGKDVLTNKHANTTIPEAQGVARAYEVTGETKWRDAALAYWKCAVTTRGAYATGGQTSGEIWTPPGKLSARLSDRNQEHCVVYNMIRLADYLLRWTGEAQYADYIERNLHNGILAQQHPQTGMVTYFLPLAAGSKKTWGTPTDDFWCCHGSLVQAHSRHERHIYYSSTDGITVSQYIPSEAEWSHKGTPVRISQALLRQADDHRVHLEVDPQSRPDEWSVEVSVDADQPVEFVLSLRLPTWTRSNAAIAVDGKSIDATPDASDYVTIRRKWSHDKVRLTFHKSLTVSPLPDRPDTVAFLYGPDVLAAIAPGEVTLSGDVKQPDAMLVPDNEREWAAWLGGFRSVNQNPNYRFVPIDTITDQAYTVYCQVRPAKG
jgi:uncharacterized protein